MCSISTPLNSFSGECARTRPTQISNIDTYSKKISNGCQRGNISEFVMKTAGIPRGRRSDSETYSGITSTTLVDWLGRKGSKDVRRT